MINTEGIKLECYNNLLEQIKIKIDLIKIFIYLHLLLIIYRKIISIIYSKIEYIELNISD